ncbi:MAG TPA: hypothetical protein VGP31_20080 [Planosporangium sp.]|nr:hypothetical protein [Planosporangium sp.]
MERVGDVVRQVGADRGWSGVVWSDLDQDTADTAIAAQVQYFASMGHEFEWKLYAHDRPDDLAGRLRAAGFTPGPEETLMVAQVGDLPTNVELPAGVHLRPVTDPAGVDLVADVHEQTFGTAHPRSGIDCVPNLPRRRIRLPRSSQWLVICRSTHPTTAARSCTGSGSSP